MNTQGPSPLKVTAPMDASDCEVRYMSGQGAKVLARRPIKITAATATLEAADEVTAGSAVDITWTGPDNRSDYITIVAKDAPDNRSGQSSTATRVGSPLKVTAPIDVGEFEIRYVGGQGSRVLARRPLKTTAASASLDAADEITAGSPIEVMWTGPDNANDYITIVKPGTPDNRSGPSSAATRVGSTVTLTTPIEPGDYEIRYVTGQGARVLARRPLKTNAAEVTFDAPDEATAGSPVSITWDGPNNSGDYITIVAKGTPDGKYGHNTRTTVGPTLKVTAPIEPGDAEIRYMSGQGAKVLGRRAIKLVAPKITLSAPEKAPAGSTITIEWSGPDNPGDYITIVPKSAGEHSSGKYAYTRDGSPLKVGMPANAGPCEIRYMDGAMSRPIARVAIECTAP